MASFPLIDILILNWNQPGDSLECLASLQGLDYPNKRIIMVDNGSTDGSPDQIAAQYPEVILLRQAENLGFCEGNNVGLRYSLANGADYVFLLNNDTTVAPDLLTRLVEAFESDQRIGMAGPTMFYYKEPTTIAAAGSMVYPECVSIKNLRDKEIDPQPTGPLQDVDFIVSCGVLVSRSALEKVGLLDARFFINGDDVDWGLRMKQAGLRVVYVPAAYMWHKISASMGQASAATTYYCTRNQYLIFGENLQGWARWVAIIKITLNTLRTVAAWTLKPRYRALARQRNANLLAMRDAFLKRYGRMGADVARVCYGR